ncbi:hypothetical protein BDN67DRAFT_1013430 [Paxillus ammoniavirescens]|nr:hypothetical protein BDN67DRAFT_1013430 [Paxillus ammoniavirescens]
MLTFESDRSAISSPLKKGRGPRVDCRNVFYEEHETTTYSPLQDRPPRRDKKLEDARYSTQHIKQHGAPLPLIWVVVLDNIMPPYAVPFSESDKGLQFIARTVFEGIYYLGKAGPGLPHGAVITYGSQQLTVQQYEVLCFATEMRWGIAQTERETLQQSSVIVSRRTSHSRDISRTEYNTSSLLHSDISRVIPDDRSPSISFPASPLSANLSLERSRPASPLSRYEGEGKYPPAAIEAEITQGTTTSTVMGSPVALAADESDVFLSPQSTSSVLPRRSSFRTSGRGFSAVDTTHQPRSASPLGNLSMAARLETRKTNQGLRRLSLTSQSYKPQADDASFNEVSNMAEVGVAMYHPSSPHRRTSSFSAVSPIHPPRSPIAESAPERQKDVKRLRNASPTSSYLSPIDHLLPLPLPIPGSSSHSTDSVSTTGPPAPGPLYSERNVGREHWGVERDVHSSSQTRAKLFGTARVSSPLVGSSQLPVIGSPGAGKRRSSFDVTGQETVFDGNSAVEESQRSGVPIHPRLSAHTRRVAIPRPSLTFPVSSSAVEDDRRLQSARDAPPSPVVSEIVGIAAMSGVAAVKGSEQTALSATRFPLLEAPRARPSSRGAVEHSPRPEVVTRHRIEREFDHTTHEGLGEDEGQGVSVPQPVSVNLVKLQPGGPSPPPRSLGQTVAPMVDATSDRDVQTSTGVVDRVSFGGKKPKHQSRSQKKRDPVATHTDSQVPMKMVTTSSGWSSDRVQDEERAPFLPTSPHAVPLIMVSPPNAVIDLPEVQPHGKRPARSDADRHKSQQVLRSEPKTSSSATSSSSGHDTAIALAEGFAIVAAASVLAAVTETSEGASARASDHTQSTGTRTKRGQAIEEHQASESESVVVLSNAITLLMFCSRQTHTMPRAPSARPLQATEPVTVQRVSSLEIKTQQEYFGDESGPRPPDGQRRVPLTAAPTTRSLTTSAWGSDHTQTTDRTRREQAIEDLQVSDSESVVILSSLIALLIFYCNQMHSLPRVTSVRPSLQTREPVISHEQRTSSLEIKAQQESFEDVSGRLPGGQRLVPLTAAPTTRSLTTSAWGSDHTQTTDKTSREQAIEDLQVSSSASVDILFDSITLLKFYSRQTNALPLVPSVRPSLQTIEPVSSHEQRVSWREIKTQQGSVEDESGPRPPVLGSRTAQIAVRSDDIKGNGQCSAPLTATPTKRSLTTDVGLQDTGLMETYQRASSQLNLSVAATETSKSSAASDASPDRRVYDIREEPPRIKRKPIPSINSERDTTEDRSQSGGTTDVYTSLGTRTPASSQSLPSSTYSTSAFGSDVRTSVSIAQVTELDRSNVVLSRGKQSSGGDIDTTSSIQIHEKKTTSEPLQSAVRSEEIHGGNNLMTSETILALGSSGRDGEASGGSGQVASLARKSTFTLSSGSQSLQSDEQTILQHSAVERRGKVDNARRLSKTDAQRISSAILSSERKTSSPSAASSSSAGGNVHDSTAISLAEGFAIAAAASALVVASNSGEKASPRGSDYTQTTDRTSREQAIEDLQITASEQTNTLPLVPSVRSPLQTKEPVISHEQRASSREVKTRQGSIEDESGPRPPVLGSRTPQSVVRSDDTKGSGQRRAPMTAAPTKHSLITNVGFEDNEAVETRQRVDSQLDLSVVVTGASESSAASYASSDRRVYDVREGPPGIKRQPIPSINSEWSTTEYRSQTGHATDVYASSGVRAPASSESLPSSTYPTSLFGSDVRTSVSIAQPTEFDRPNVVLSTGKQSSGEHLNASSSIQIRERKTTSESLEFAVDTKESHGVNELTTSETFLALDSSSGNGEALGSDDRVASLACKSNPTLSSSNQSQITVGVGCQSLQPDERTMLQRREVGRRGTKVDATTGSSPLETTPQTKEYFNGRRLSKMDAQRPRNQAISSVALSSERKTSSLAAALNPSADAAVHGTTNISFSEGFAIAAAASAFVGVRPIVSKQLKSFRCLSQGKRTHCLSSRV